MNRLKQALIRFMAGRYGGNDAFNRFLMILYVVFLVCSLFFKSIALQLLAFAAAFYLLFRTFSRNYNARVKENSKLLSLQSKLKQEWKLLKNKWRDRKTHVYRKCPYCKSTVRLPKKKGQHGVRCPCCRRDFQVKI